jgi:hypothetical protein
LTAPPEKVFEVVSNPLIGAPVGVKVSIDHSASQSGPDRWGVGSRIHADHENEENDLTICKYDPPHLIVQRSTQKKLKRTIRFTHIYKLEPTTDGGTLLTVHSYATPDDQPWFNWRYQRNYRRIFARDLGGLVAQFGGEVLEVTN